MIIYLTWNLYSVIFFLALCDFSLSLPEIASWLQTINFEICSSWHMWQIPCRCVIVFISAFIRLDGDVQTGQNNLFL